MSTDIFNFLGAKNMRTKHMVGKTGEEKRSELVVLRTPHSALPSAPVRVLLLCYNPDQKWLERKGLIRLPLPCHSPAREGAQGRNQQAGTEAERAEKCRFLCLQLPRDGTAHGGAGPSYIS